MDLLEDILGGEQSHTISRYLNDEEIRHIKDMITSEKGGQPAPPGKRWLYEVSLALLSTIRTCICALQDGCCSCETGMVSRLMPVALLWHGQSCLQH